MRQFDAPLVYWFCRMFTYHSTRPSSFRKWSCHCFSDICPDL